MNKKDIIVHMLKHAADMIMGTEAVLPQIDATVYSKQTKDHIKTHLSYDIANLLTMIEPAFDMMKEEFPERKEQIERWEKLHIQVKEYRLRDKDLQEQPEVVQSGRE